MKHKKPNLTSDDELFKHVWLQIGRCEGLTTLSGKARELGWNNVDENLMLKMFILLYADDTVICTESIEDLQRALDAMSTYCNKWSLRVNATKTKVLVFSRGKLRSSHV